jgi:hypothetical protein
VKHTPLPNLPGLAAHLARALPLLIEGAVFARDTKQDAWQFAVEASDLLSAGLTKNSLRWLVHKKLVLQAVEIAGPRGKCERCFRPISDFRCAARVCLVLTEAGLGFARRLEKAALLEPHLAGKAPTATTSAPAQQPQWDATARILSWRGEVVKHFRVPAANQELVLSAFQEEGWPASIYDPLQPAPGIDAKRRLHDTINRLNRNQRRRLLRFFGNGNGQAIRWAPTH